MLSRKKRGRKKGERNGKGNPSSHFPLDRAKHGNEGRWRPPSSPSPVGSYISSSSWLLKFMSTVVTRFIRDEKNRTDILYAFCEDACTPGLASLTHRGVSCSRTRGVNKIALLFSFSSPFFFLNGIVAGDVLSRCDDDGSLRKLIEFYRAHVEFLLERK